MIDRLPTEFRGIIFDDGWEFDAPCILYYPIKRYDVGGNHGHIINMVESYCIDLILDAKPRKGWSEFDLREFRWRGWSPRGFSRRKRGTHIRVKVKWFLDNKQQLTFEMQEVEFGPFCVMRIP